MTIDDQIAILQAAKAGKTIQFKRHGCAVDAWTELVLNEGYRFDFTRWEYRVKPEPRVAYANLYSTGQGETYQSRSHAELGACHGRIACVRVEYQEGQFDD